MAEVLNFEHNGITVNATESPEAMGGLGAVSYTHLTLPTILLV